MSEIPLKGTVLGFEEYVEYCLRNTFDPLSPFRILASLQVSLAFLVVNPFVLVEDYDLEIDDRVVQELELTGDAVRHVAVMCVARKEKEHYLVNLRSPLIINTTEGRFRQVILQNESYGTSAAFTVDKEGRPL